MFMKEWLILLILSKIIGDTYYLMELNHIFVLMTNLILITKTFLLDVSKKAQLLNCHVLYLIKQPKNVHNVILVIIYKTENVWLTNAQQENISMMENASIIHSDVNHSTKLLTALNVLILTD